MFEKVSVMPMHAYQEQEITSVTVLSWVFSLIFSSINPLVPDIRKKAAHT